MSNAGTMLSRDALTIHLSHPRAGRGFAFPSEPTQSLGGWISTTPLDTEFPKGNLFGDLTIQEGLDSSTHHRCVFVRNTDDETAFNVRVWALAPANGPSIVLGADPTPASDVGLEQLQQALHVPTENDSPIDVAFQATRTKKEAVRLGDIAPGECRAFWIKRTAKPRPEPGLGGVDLVVEADTL